MMNLQCHVYSKDHNNSTDNNAVVSIVMLMMMIIVLMKVMITLIAVVIMVVVTMRVISVDVSQNPSMSDSSNHPHRIKPELRL